MTEQTFRIEGMDCADEVAILKKELGPLVGGEERLAFDVLRGRLTVAAETASAEAVRGAVARTGMKAEPWQDSQQRDEGTDRQRRLQSRLTAASGLLTAAGLATHAWLAGGLGRALGGEGVPLAAKALYLLAIVAGGWFIAPKAWYALRRLRPDMNLLMTVAVTGAVGIGEWFEAATVAFLFALSNALESWSVGRARRAVEALMDLSPTTARSASGSPSWKRIRCSLPARQILRSRESDSALTTDTPTPCRPPDTL